jgi:hypothetical protein
MDIKLGIIDIDGLFYHSVKETLGKSIQTFQDKFQNLVEKTGITHYIGFYSKGKYFRHSINPEYKIGRVGRPVPKYLKTLKEWAIAEYGLQNMYQVEADDLAAYWINNFIHHAKFINPHSDSHWMFCNHELVKSADEWKDVEKILCTPDKDLLESIPGKHFNYSYKLKDDIKALVKEDVLYQIKKEGVIKGWWIETNDEEANYFKLKQLISGDTADGIKTLFPKNAGDWFVKNKMNFNDVVSAYILGFNYETPTGIKKYKKGFGTSLGLFELVKNYRLLHMLESDEDFMREVGKLPTFPIITEIDKELKDEPELKF